MQIMEFETNYDALGMTGSHAHVACQNSLFCFFLKKKQLFFIQKKCPVKTANRTNVFELYSLEIFSNNHMAFIIPPLDKFSWYFKIVSTNHSIHVCQSHYLYQYTCFVLLSVYLYYFFPRGGGGGLVGGDVDFGIATKAKTNLSPFPNLTHPVLPVVDWQRDQRKPPKKQGVMNLWQQCFPPFQAKAWALAC